MEHPFGQNPQARRGIRSGSKLIERLDMAKAMSFTASGVVVS